MTTRRSVLRSLGLVSVGLLAGCSAIDSDPKPGSLLVVNNDGVDHTLRLDITRSSDESATRQETVRIGAGEWGLRNKLLTDPGSYEITVTVGESDETAATTVEVTPSGNGKRLGGENLEVYIDRDGTLRATARTYD
ncbi:hypothetical protein SAMN04487950_3212 [Halogranum rubrum]|uniref:Uncharacterized protein n=1 Tax=Halogranum rubrum TaxID=553466 RepID=A0A1I4GD40_9EURY|nr:hypothetical protein [Halogranum rubrum]SFL27972.1 hypothetical protein SAMN04487950_3212 [Halogranum rubrum]